MSDYPMLISNKLHSFRNFHLQIYNLLLKDFDFIKYYNYLCARFEKSMYFY